MRTIPAVVAAVLAAAALLVSAGCIHVGVGGDKGEPPPPEKFHVLEAAESPRAAPPVVTVAGPVVAVRTFRAATRFDRHVLRRDGPGRATPLDFDLWADEPAEAVTETVRETFARTGRFRAAVDPADAHVADLLVDGALLEFAVELPEGGAAKAVVRLRITWSDARTGTVLRSALHETTEPVPGPGTDGLGPAMARAVARAATASLEGAIPLPPRGE